MIQFLFEEATMISLNIPPFGLTAAERERADRFDEALTRLLAQNWITERMGWSSKESGGRRTIAFGRFQIDATKFMVISDDDLFRRVQSALAG
jgi:hypothetical protein